MATVMDDEWRALRSLPRWTPLRSLGRAAIRVASDLYRIGDDAYALAQPITRDLEEGHPDAPFVTMLFWSPSASAARRAALNQVDADDGATASPPGTLCPGIDPPTYGAVLASGRPGRPSSPLERATYAADGRFVHKVIDLPDRHFYYRSVEIDPDEMPYAIGLILRDSPNA